MIKTHPKTHRIIIPYHLSLSLSPSIKKNTLHTLPILSTSMLHTLSFAFFVSDSRAALREKMAGDGKMGEDRLRAVSFAAGTAAFMACVERAFVVSVFMHWRVWAFLALNLLLLAILFTSTSEIPSNDEVCSENGEDGEIKKCKKRRHQPQVVPIEAEETPPPPPAAVVVEETGEIEGKVEDYDELSEEELKQRVEDFIAMFRQHLICDAKGVKIMTSNAIAPRVH